MEGFVSAERFGSDALSGRMTSLLHPGLGLIDFEGIANFQANHEGNGSGVPALADEIKAIAIANLKTTYSAFDNVITDYLNASEQGSPKDVVDPLVDQLTGSLLDTAQTLTNDLSSQAWLSSDEMLAKAISMATDSLTEFKGRSDFLDNMTLAFGEDITASEAISAIDSLLSGEANISLKIAQIDHANTHAAFAADTNTVYLSSEFVDQNIGSPERIADVLLEEWGHYVDSILNDFDSAGDEGEIFANLVKDATFDIDALKAEDDHATLSIDGNMVSVEQAAFERTIVTNRTLVYQSDRGSILAFTRNPRNRLAVDIIFRNGRTGPIQTGQNIQGINLFGGQFSIVTSPSSSRRLVPDANGNLQFVQGDLAPLLTVRAPRWTRIQ